VVFGGIAPVSRHFKWRARSIASFKVARYDPMAAIQTVFVLAVWAQQEDSAKQ
jgi:hypothetical protein